MKNLTAILFLIMALALQAIANDNMTIDLTQRQDVILEWQIVLTTATIKNLI